jgi:3-isopropylmalate/(R)-2-methylmalate dehydratase small subunit
MQRFTLMTAAAAPLPLTDVDTDQIIPARFLQAGRGQGSARACLHDLRFDAAGQPRPAFPLNHPDCIGAPSLVTGSDFGCGSSREEAVYALWDMGVRCIIAEGFGDIFAGNALQNGLLPVVLPGTVVDALLALLSAAPGERVTVDLREQTVTTTDGAVHRFAISPSARRRLLEGVDELAVTLDLLPRIEAHDLELTKAWPWNAELTGPDDPTSSA